MSLAGWSRWALNAARERWRPTQNQDDGWWSSLEGHPDALAALVDWKRATARHQLYIGLDADSHGVTFADRDSPVLVLGASGSNKSSAIMAPNCMLAGGPLFCVSSRADLFRITARVRRRMGQVLHFSALGKKVPGARRVRFSPLQGCNDYSYAQKTGLRWASWIDRSEYAIQTGARGHPHFRARTAALLGSLFFISAAMDHDMGWLYEFITGPSVGKSIITLRREIDAEPDAGQLLEALKELDFMGSISPEERGSILTTTANALGAYRDPKVVKQSNDPNLDFDAFVRGRPEQTLAMEGFDTGPLAQVGIWPHMRGSFDSLYITDANAESPVAFIVMDVEYRIREAMYDYSLERELAGESKPSSLTIVNDEGAVAPPVQLSALLAEMRDRGVLLVMAIQSMSQAETIFGRIGEDFFTMFRTTVVFPGIKDDKTLKTLSVLAGQFWQRVVSQNQTWSAQGVSTGSSDSWQLTEQLRPHQIAFGHPEWVDGVLVIPTDAQFFWLDSPPYFRSEPWPRLLINSLEVNIHDENRLPLPPLAQDGDTRHLDQLGLTERFRRLQDHFRQL